MHVFEGVCLCEGGRWVGVNAHRWVSESVRVIRSVSLNVLDCVVGCESDCGCRLCRRVDGWMGGCVDV